MIGSTSVFPTSPCAEGVNLGQLPANLQDLIQAIKEADAITPGRARVLLGECSVKASDLEMFADFDHPAADSYGRNMVYDGGQWELMVMSWADGDMAAIHDHGHTQWGAVKLFGNAEHAMFKLSDDCLTTVERRVFAAGDVVAVGHDLIHQMGNRGQQPFLSLHLYGCYERDGDITADARLYELDQGVVQIVDGGVFFALPNDEVKGSQKGSRADFPTTLRNKVELLERLLRISGSLEHGMFRDPRETRLATELFAAQTWHRCTAEQATMNEAQPLLRDRYQEILNQELAAAASTQLRLLDAGLVEHAMHEDLRSAVAESDLEAFGARYFDLLAEHLGVTLASAPAVACA